MDDDAALLDGEAIERALRLLEADPQVARRRVRPVRLAWRQVGRGDAAGRSRAACYVPSFIGFAHLVRRESFVAIGGYRESFEFYGEEKDSVCVCIDAGYRTVYLPDALVMHEPDQASRSKQRYLRYVTRNDCLNALYNDPLSRLAWLVPARLAIYFRMRRAWKIDDPWGWAWILRELWSNAGSVFRNRKPVSAETVAVWKRSATPEPSLGKCEV